MTKKKYLIHIISEPSAQCSVVSSMQRRQLNASTVSSTARSVNAGPSSSMQGRQLSAAPSAQCSAVSSMQAPSAHCRAVRTRQLNAGAVCFNAGPSVSMQGCLLNAGRSVCSTQKLLKARHHLNAVPCRLLHAGPVCSMRGPSAQRGTPFCSTQGRQLDAERSRGRQLKAGPSAQCKAVRFNAGPCVWMQGSLNARPSLQCRATSSTQGRHLNAWAFGWLDQDLLRELSSEKKPTPWCLFSEEAYFGRWLWSVGVWWSVARRWEGREEEAYSKVPFLFRFCSKKKSSSYCPSELILSRIFTDYRILHIEDLNLILLIRSIFFHCQYLNGVRQHKFWERVWIWFLTST